MLHQKCKIDAPLVPPLFMVSFNMYNSCDNFAKHNIQNQEPVRILLYAPFYSVYLLRPCILQFRQRVFTYKNGARNTGRNNVCPSW